MLNPVYKTHFEKLYNSEQKNAILAANCNVFSRYNAEYSQDNNKKRY